MVSLRNNLLFLLLLSSSLAFSQSYTYRFTDPCTLENRSILVNNPTENIVFNYFGEVETFTGTQISDGTFDAWISNVAQQFTNSPCQGVTQVIVNGINNVTTANTLTVTTNIMSVMGGGMLPPAESVNNSTTGNSDQDSNENNSSKSSSQSDEGGTSNSQNNSNNGNNSNQSGGSKSSGSNTSNKETKGNQSSSKTGEESGSTTGGESGGSNKSTQGGEQTSESSVNEAEGSSSQSTANSVSNSIDGGSSGGKKKKSNKAQKQAASLIASGDVVVISNTDDTAPGQVRIVGSLTHANTTNTRIKGALFTYTTVTNDFSLTFYKSWINPKKTFNLVLANTTSTNFKNSLLNTTTALESFRFGKGKKYTGMFGVNFTMGKLGERSLQNLSSVAGIHRGFKVSPRISTSLLVLGVYSPFTQFYDGKWWDAGVLVVPFNSWDIKLTKTFKYNISFTGVYQTSGSFLNYQILTGGKLNF